MQRMKFSRLSLLSQNERRALQIDFSSPATVLVAGNAFGKSAILKSLYDALGARPLKMEDDSWRAAGVATLLEFSIQDRNYAALRSGDSYTILDDARRVLIRTSRVVKELAPFLAELFSFKLVLTDKSGSPKIPPPSFIFAPYYVDQDAGWQKAWSSFADTGMFRHPAKALSEYHSGLKPNSYYEAKADRDVLKSELTKIEAERHAIEQAIQKIQDSMPSFPLHFDLDSFKQETDWLVREGQELHDSQSRYRNELAVLSEEFHVWADQISMLEAAIAELDASFRDALGEAPDVECPMCGEHYTNHIADQFELVADKDELFQALQVARNKHGDLRQRVQKHREQTAQIEAAIDRTNQILTSRREDLSLQDVVAAQGRNEAQRILFNRLSLLDAEAGQKNREIAEADQRMKDAESKTRKDRIGRFFSDRLAEFATAIDVDLPSKGKEPIQGLHIGRGSVSPRALAAYYYAFLHTAAEFGSAVFCPIVIDAPNQQGQDSVHLQQIMEFLLTKPPPGSQVIIGAEALQESWGAEVLDVTNEKKRVLRQDRFASVVEHMTPFLNQSIL